MTLNMPGNAGRGAPRSSGMRAGQTPKMRRRRSQKRFRASPRGRRRMNQRLARCGKRGEEVASHAVQHGVVLGNSDAPIKYVSVKTLRKAAARVVRANGGDAHKVGRVSKQIAALSVGGTEVRLRSDQRPKLTQLIRDAFYEATGEVLR